MSALLTSAFRRPKTACPDDDADTDADVRDVLSKPQRTLVTAFRALLGRPWLGADGQAALSAGGGEHFTLDPDLTERGAASG